MLRRRIENRPFLGEDVSECVVELLELRRRWLHAAAIAAYPYAAVVAHGLEPALARNLYPVHPAVRLLLPADAGVHRGAAARLQKRRQTFLQLVRGLLDSNNLTSVGDAKDDHASRCIGERTNRLAYAGKIPESALELRPRSLTFVDSPANFRPFHLQNPGAIISRMALAKFLSLAAARASTIGTGASATEYRLPPRRSIARDSGHALRISMSPQPYASRASEAVRDGGHQRDRITHGQHSPEVKRRVKHRPCRTRSGDPMLIVPLHYDFGGTDFESRLQSLSCEPCESLLPHGRKAVGSPFAPCMATQRVHHHVVLDGAAIRGPPATDHRMGATSRPACGLPRSRRARLLVASKVVAVPGRDQPRGAPGPRRP